MKLNENDLSYISKQKPFEFNGNTYINNTFYLKQLKERIAKKLNKNYNSDNLSSIRIIDKDIEYQPNNIELIPNLHQIKYGDNIGIILIRNDGKVKYRKNTKKGFIDFDTIHYIDSKKYKYLIDLRSHILK